MEKLEPWQQNKNVDPNYPFRTRLNESGETVYSIPLEAPNDIPLDETAGGANHVEYSYLSVFGGKVLRVYWLETTDRELAYTIRSMLNTQQSQERRFAEHYTVVPEVLGNGLGDGNHKVCCKTGEESEWPSDEGRKTANQDHGRQNGYEQHGWPDVEKQALDRIELQTILDLVKSTDPRCWEIFYQVKLYGEEAKAVAARLGISVQRVHQLAARVPEIAKHSRRENR